MFEDIFSRLPANPPRSIDLLPGLRLRSILPSRSVAVGLGLTVLLCGVVPALVLLDDPDVRLSIGETRAAEARVVGVSENNACHGQGRSIAYVFAPTGSREYRVTRSVCPGSPYFGIREGDVIAITFLVSDPTVNSIAEAGQQRWFASPMTLALSFSLLVLLGFIPMFMPQIREILRARRLFRTGLIAQGRVVFVRSRSSWWPYWPAGGAAEVLVAHELPGGRVVESTVKCSNDWLLRHLPAGATVHIAYLPTHPNQAALLEAFVR